MVEEEQSDLRILSLLHALGDREEFVRETCRLLVETDLNEASWRQVWNLGRDVAPDHPLFEFGKTLNVVRCESAGFLPDSGSRNTFYRRSVDKRAERRGVVSDRRLEERRTTNLPWLGVERRKCERRYSSPEKEMT